MNEFFATKDVEHAFRVSHQTVKNWCDEFADYLSVTARPTPGRKRVFTADDMQVFALVAEYHRMGFRYEDVHVALQAGQRSVIPSNEADMTAQPPAALLVKYQEEIVSIRLELAQVKTERDETRGQNKLLEKQLADKERRIEELYEKLAELKAQIKH